jgi:hypothetical protein
MSAWPSRGRSGQCSAEWRRSPARSSSNAGAAPTLAGMSLAISLAFAFALFYALGREHGKRSASRASGRKQKEWSPFDDFHSGR